VDECGLITQSTEVLLFPSLECQDCIRFEVRISVHILIQSMPVSSFLVVGARMDHSDSQPRWTGDSMLIVISTKISRVVLFSSFRSRGGW